MRELQCLGVSPGFSTFYVNLSNSPCLSFLISKMGCSEHAGWSTQKCLMDARKTKRSGDKDSKKPQKALSTFLDGEVSYTCFPCLLPQGLFLISPVLCRLIYLWSCSCNSLSQRRWRTTNKQDVCWSQMAASRGPFGGEQEGRGCGWGGRRDTHEMRLQKGQSIFLGITDASCWL